jgi:hypothetical protein
METDVAEMARITELLRRLVDPRYQVRRPRRTEFPEPPCTPRPPRDPEPVRPPEPWCDTGPEPEIHVKSTRSRKRRH